METLRSYTQVIKQHLATDRQMAFITGPRQVGKTTVAKQLSDHYFNWDNDTHKRLISKGPDAVAAEIGLNQLGAKPPVIAFDEIHKYGKWKSFLKGFFDTYEKKCRIIVTGSARLDIYKRGGDSMMGRYFLYHMHPLTVGELLNPTPSDDLIAQPKKIAPADWDALITHGGFPEPFTRRDNRVSSRWRKLRLEQLLKEDVRDTTRIHELAQLEIAGTLLTQWSGQQLSFSRLADEVRVSPETIRKWVPALVGLHHGFLVRPWSKNIARSLRKEPKWFLRDWSGIADEGARTETMVACHLLKAVEMWNDLGLGTFALHYLRDADQREVDFVVVRDNKPWFLVEAKTSDTTLSPALTYFQKQTGAPHAFQAVRNMPFVKADCFKEKKPTAVPMMTLFSQLV